MMTHRRRAGLALVAVCAGLLFVGGSVRAADEPGAEPDAAEAEAVSAARADITISAGWTRATPGNATNAAVYLRINNAGSEPERLIGARIAAGERTEIHTGGLQDGVMRMEPAQAITIPASGSVSFEPNGNHLMVIGLRAPLMEGESFLAVLEFERGGSQTTAVKILAANAMGPPTMAVGNSGE